MKTNHVVVALTGASGVVYGLRLVHHLLRSGVTVTVLVSEAGLQVVREECGLTWGGDEKTVQLALSAHFHAGADRLRYHDARNLLAPIASGSAAPDAMVVCPASMGTVGRVAAGFSGNLIERCADVMLKERRQLLLVPREMPLSQIHLENMLRLSRAGATIIPAMPAFYHHPASVEDLVDFVVGKVLDLLGHPHDLFQRWGGGAVDHG